MPRRPKLGQHFLTDQRLLEHIAAAGVHAGDTAIEIGPGRGALTVHLVSRAGRVLAVEVDRTLAQALPSQCGHPPNLEVVRQDVLKFDLQAALQDSDPRRCVVVGNLPYYITSPILRAAFSASRLLRSATFLMQEDVADRAVARSGSRSYGYLSCLCHLHSRPSKLFSVSPDAFAPPPKVRSAVVQFTMRPTSPPDSLVAFVGACFRHPRKTLKNNLSGTYPSARLDEDRLGGLRAQQLDVDELAAMWLRLQT